MARATRTDGQETRERILEVALPLFAESGYAGTSVRTIASAAGVNVATLAYHFSDKEGLYDTVVQRLHVDLADHFPTQPPVGAPREVVGWWIRTGWTFVKAHRSHVSLLVRHVLDHGRLPDVVLERWSDRLMNQAQAVVGMFRPEWTSVQRRMLVITLMHLTVRLSLEHPDQLAHMSGMPADGVDDGVVDWLTDLTMRELGLG
jgi:AcrR family transcriptional regulator